MALGLILASIDVGQYVNAWKVIPPLLLLLGWFRILTWIDKDAPGVHLPRVLLNTIYLVVGIFAVFLYMLMPGFWSGFPLLLFFLMAEVGSYLFIRQQRVGLSDLKIQFRKWLASWKSKSSDQAKEKGVRVNLFNSKGGEISIPAENNPDFPAYEALQGLLIGPLQRHAERIEMTPAENAFAIRYAVDGCVYNDVPMHPLSGAAAITYLKKIGGMDVNEKRKPQSSVIKAGVGKNHFDLNLRVAGSKAGESATILVNAGQRHGRRVADLGFTSEQLQLVQDSAKENKGIVLVGTLKHQGMSNLLYAMARAHDAFISHIQTIEHNSKTTLEGITQNKLAATTTAADEIKLVSWVTSQEPEVLLVDRVDDARSAVELLQYARRGKRLYIGMRAANTFEMLDQWRKLIGDDEAAMLDLRMLVAGRMVRKLCDACKVAYTPDANLLKKLNMDPAKVGKFYQARTSPLRDPKGRPIPCSFCQDLHFKGLQGIFEIMSVDDEIRKAVTDNAPINQIKTLFRKQRGRYLQEQGLALVEKGITSVEEVVRVMRLTSESTAKIGVES